MPFSLFCVKLYHFFVAAALGCPVFVIIFIDLTLWSPMGVVIEVRITKKTLLLRHRFHQYAIKTKISLHRSLLLEILPKVMGLDACLLSPCYFFLIYLGSYWRSLAKM